MTLVLHPVGCQPVPDVGGLHLGEGLGSPVGVRAGVSGEMVSSLPAVAKVPVGIRPDTAGALVGTPGLPPESVLVSTVGVTVRVGHGQNIPESCN